MSVPKSLSEDQNRQITRAVELLLDVFELGPTDVSEITLKGGEIFVDQMSRNPGSREIEHTLIYRIWKWAP